MATALPRIDANFTLGDLARATGATLHGPPALRVEGVSTDSRMIHPGSLFVALKGERFDGHDHVAAALRAGARAVLVARGRHTVTEAPALEVDDTLVALGAIAKFHGERVRALSHARVAAIGGAVGKTTTKELCAAAFRAAFGETHATRGNLNNLVGAPLTLLGLNESHRAAVIECGTNAPGEIARIGDVVRPEVALVLNAHLTHAEGLGSVEGVTREEGSLFAFASRAVVTGFDERGLREEMKRAPAGCARWYFGSAPGAQVSVLGAETTAEGRWRVSLGVAPALCEGVGRLTVETSLVGANMWDNIAAALCVTAAAGATADGLRAAAEAIGKVEAVPGRLALRTLGGGVRVIDDTYNASPHAVQSALNAALLLVGEAKREVGGVARRSLVVALGDMLELGAHSGQAHAEVGDQVAFLHPAAFVAVGNEMRLAARAAEASGECGEVRTARDSTEAAVMLRELVRPGDLVLVKGSRGMRMERCVEALVEAWP
jgi:UDP-N-acetylmuramoyl-tripeptide--D-alanyl-D-alanine ligase